MARTPRGKGPDKKKLDKIATVLSEAGLSKHRGGKVTGLGVAVSNTGHGLETTVEVDPIIIQPGDTAFVIFEVEPDKDRYDKKYNGDGDWTGEWTFVPMLKAIGCTILLSDSAPALREAIDAQNERITIAREEGQGVHRLDYDLSKAHAEGEHADGLVEGCAACELEAGLDASETLSGKDAAAKAGINPEPK